MARYRNPFHSPGRPEYGPPEYVTEVSPRHYRGFEIYHRGIEVYDVVQDGTCLGQFAGPDGARSNIDAYLDETGVHYLRMPSANPQQPASEISQADVTTPAVQSRRL